MNKYIILSIFATIALWACNNSHEHEHNHGHDSDKHNIHETAEHKHGDDEIVLEPHDAERFGVKTSVISPVSFNEIISVSGQIIPSTSDQAIVVAPTAGIVKLIPGLTSGMKLNAGAPVATVSSRNVSGGDPNESARIAMEAAKRELDRLTPLMADGLVTRREYNAAQQAYDSARAAYSGNAASGRAVTPISGTVTQVMVKEGEFVETGSPIAAIAKNTRLTLRADLPERYMKFLPSIKTANFRPAYSDSTFVLDDMDGKIVAQASAAGELQGYVPVYFTLDNNGSIVPGTSAEVYLIGATRNDALVVPVEAVTEAQGTHYIYVKKSEHGYEKRPVTLGNSDGRSIEILSGITPGEEVVTENVTFVKLAENSGVVPEGHSHNH